MSMTKILPCTCKHEFQDTRYGKNLRVHNEMDGKKGKWRCTVCKAEHSSGDSEAAN